MFGEHIGRRNGIHKLGRQVPQCGIVLGLPSYNSPPCCKPSMFYPDNSTMAQFKVFRGSFGANFNSTLVRLKEFYSIIYFIEGECFNSTLVRLKATVSPNSPQSRKCFNSTLVRLKVNLGVQMFIPLRCFNSTLVRLKGVCRTATGHGGMSFNSTLVRLKGEIRSR